jgi:predicted permease
MWPPLVALASRLRALVNRHRLDDDTRRECEAHIEALTARNIRAGMGPDEAHAAARRQFGNATLLREEIYRLNRIDWLDSAARDLRYAVRSLRKSPTFSLAAIVTLAVGIGGTTAIFTLIHAVMLRSLPVTDPAALYRIGDGDSCCVVGGPQDRWGMFSYRLYERLKTEMPEFEEVTAFEAEGSRLRVRREGEGVAARPLRSEYVTGTYFSTLGIGAFAGRVFGPADDTPSSPPVAVLSHNAWQGTYGADPSVVGSSFAIEGHPFTIVGVAPPGFFGDTLRGDPPDVWIPLQQEPLIEGDSEFLRQSPTAWLRVIGRLRPGATTAGMAPRLTGVLRHWMQYDSAYPADWMPDVIRTLPRQTIAVVPAGAGVGVMKEEYGRSLQLLLAVCGLVLLVACANVANLLLARALARRGQTAVRLAIGASRRQVVTQALVESVLLAVGGEIAGVVVAMGLARLLLSLAFSGVAFLPISTRPALVVLGVGFGLALVTGVLVGIAPAWFATRTDPIDALRGAGRSTRDRFSLARKALLVAQAALSIVLVAGATMLGRSLNKLEHQDFGYQVHDRVVVALKRPADDTQPKLAALYREIQTRLDRLPGVEASALALYNPLAANWSESVLVAGHPAPKANNEPGASWDRVSASYLQNLGMTMVRGRAFTAADDESAAPVAIVNEAFVKRFFESGEDPLDQHFGLELAENAGTYRIIGVVRDAKFTSVGLDRPARPMFYVPLAQKVDYADASMERLEQNSHAIRGIMLVTSATLSALEPAITRALAEVDPNLTILSVRTMEQQVALSLGQERAVAGLAGLFGIVALLLAAVGLYGMAAYGVAQRTNEIGIRMALGAGRGKVVNLVLQSAFRQVVIGVLLGIPLAIGAGRLISAQLYGVSFWDPLALVVAAGSLAACALVAALIPAARAASISPMNTLRTE